MLVLEMQCLSYFKLLRFKVISQLSYIARLKTLCVVVTLEVGYVQNISGSDKKEMEKDTGFMVLADDLIKVIESSILTFNVFLKMDKKKPNGGIHLFGNHNNNHVNSTTPLLLVQSSIDKVRFLCTQMLLLSYASLVSHKRGTFAEKGESKGAFKEDKRAEKEIMASNMGRCSTLVCSH